MSRTQLNLRLPEGEKEALRTLAYNYGISMSALVRILAIQDREQGERAAIIKRMYPDRCTDRA